MAPLVPALTNVTIGKETVWGTGVNATLKLMDVLDAPVVDPGAKFAAIPTIRGGLSPKAYLFAKTMEIPPAFSWKHVGTYEDIAYHLEQLTGVVTPSGAGPYVRAGAAPLTAVVAAPRLQTMYASQLDATDGYFYRVLGTIAKKIKLSAKNNEWMVVEVERLAKQVESTTATPAGTGTLTDRTVTPIMGNDFQLFLDAWGGTIGTNQITPPGYEWNLEIDSGRTLDQQLGSPYAVGYKEGEWTAKLDLTLIWSASSKAYVDATFGSGSLFQKQLRSKFLNGTNIAQFDFGGTILAGPKIGEGANETVVVKLPFEMAYNSGLANWFKYSLTNSVATLA